ncbi:hypothetical protein C5C36_15530 [Rathayibacter sp. AY1G1]|uniref:hypothetical protein n=1 Tax=unclassified Rathayibacter TaxID=2609250 RepID=UPI000CE7A320|nr:MULTISPECIES: hypothetical protein [unclassified Rathayibacter]PPF09953.1 hypothetical protein C5B98_13835 [Rathayibacter sp. AY1A5]PPF25819.1 hypothetical protein C5C54_14310 [Rathayibacter sp. AY1F2]PPF33115.1 hypothetical protein C5B93_14520 [Rathayibacter sp. AY1A2]PPF69124.1 hypothetical protein C5C46_13675 [Rathayibacter sp. AY1E6]PPG09003.1 hypothetical protein C5C26_07015 [Rathayibacter sp. AY2B1]
MGAYDEAEDLPSPPRHHRGVTVVLLVLLTSVLAGVVAVFMFAVGSLDDSTSGAVPPSGSGQELVYELVPVLNDDPAIAKLLPANTESDSAGLRDACGALADRDSEFTIIDGATPATFRVALDAAADAPEPQTCWIGFRWVKDEGWRASAIRH